MISVMIYLCIFILLIVLFVKLICLLFRVLRNGVNVISDAWDAMVSRFYDLFSFRWKTAKQMENTFPKDVFPSPTSYSIDQSTFNRIVNKNAYRHTRVEEVHIDENQVRIDFMSQSKMTRNHATLTFATTGTLHDIGNYLVQTDNFDSSIPQHIGDRIRDEIREYVTTK